MKAQCKALGGRITFEVTGETPKDVFAQIGDLMEVFDAEHICGLCNSSDIRLGHRKAGAGGVYDYYELRCNHCGAQFSFGQRKQGGALFPKRRDKDGKDLPHGGWYQYAGADPQDEDDPGNYPPAPAPLPQQAAPPSQSWGEPPPPRSSRHW